MVAMAALSPQPRDPCDSLAVDLAVGTLDTEAILWP